MSKQLSKTYDQSLLNTNKVLQGFFQTTQKYVKITTKN